MAYGVVHKFAGGTKEQYEASIAAVHPEGGGLPEGQLFHAAGPSAGGWTIIAVHDSREGWERFRDGILMPRMAQGIAGGFTAPPEETGFEIYNGSRPSRAQFQGSCLATGKPGGYRSEGTTRFWRGSPAHRTSEDVLYSACERGAKRRIEP